MPVKKVNVKGYLRKNKKGRKYRVKKHKRKHRKLGKKLLYRDVGRFQVLYDDLGNFRGSRVIKDKTKKIKPLKPLKLKVKSKKTKTRKIKPRKRTVRKKTKRKQFKLTQNDVDTEYYLGNISFNTWMEARSGLKY